MKRIGVLSITALVVCAFSIAVTTASASASCVTSVSWTGSAGKTYTPNNFCITDSQGDKLQYVPWNDGGKPVDLLELESASGYEGNPQPAVWAVNGFEAPEPLNLQTNGEVVMQLSSSETWENYASKSPAYVKPTASTVWNLTVGEPLSGHITITETETNGGNTVTVWEVVAPKQYFSGIIENGAEISGHPGAMKWSGTKSQSFVRSSFSITTVEKSQVGRLAFLEEGLYKILVPQHYFVNTGPSTATLNFQTDGDIQIEDGAGNVLWSNNATQAASYLQPYQQAQWSFFITNPNTTTGFTLNETETIGSQTVTVWQAKVS